jgi:hypothetical protein
MKILRMIDYEVMEMLKLGGYFVGGYPLTLCGGAGSATDRDLYAPDDDTRTVLTAFLRRRCQKLDRTTHTQPYRSYITNKRYELVDKGFKDFTWDEMIQNSDLTPSAVALTMHNGSVKVFALYPDDINKRVCRVLEEHEWTDYRVTSYKAKGYQVIR